MKSKSPPLSSPPATAPRQARPALQTLIQLLLLAAVAAVFLPVCGYEFLNYDDKANVYQNGRLINLSLASLLQFWTEPFEKLYIPLTYTVWGLLAGLTSFFPPANGLAFNPAVFHAANLLVHGLSVLVLFRLLRLMLQDDWAAGAGALLFAVHPVQVETVAWVTGLKDAQSGLFSLLALWQYGAYLAADTTGLPWTHRRYGLASFFFLAALLSKPGAVTLPLAAGALAYFLGKRPARRLAIELGPWLLLAVPVVWITKSSQPVSHFVHVPPVWQRFLIAGDAITFYLGKLALPLTLGPDYGRTPQYVLAQGWAYGTGLLPYLLAALLLWKYRRPWAMAAAGVFSAALLPVLGFSHFDFQANSTVADRYLYLAMLGPSLTLGWVLCQHQKSLALRLLVLAALLLFGLRGAVQVRVWQNSLVFHRHALTVNPASSSAYNNLGDALAEAGRFDEAIPAFQQAIALAPNYPEPYNNLGQLYRNKGLLQEAIVCFNQAVANNPNDASSYFYLADLYRDNGSKAEAVNYYALGLERTSPGPEAAMGYVNLGLLHKELNNNDLAIAAFLKALAIKPDFAEVYHSLGLAYEAVDKDKAMRMYQQALALRPDLAATANNLGLLYLGMKREQEAIPLFQQAITLYPDNPLPYNNMGLAYSNLGQLAEAITWLQKAITVNPSYAPAFNNLSRAYLQLGQIPTALDYADKAKALGYSDPAHLEALERQQAR